MITHGLEDINNVNVTAPINKVNVVQTMFTVFVEGDVESLHST